MDNGHEAPHRTVPWHATFHSPRKGDSKKGFERLVALKWLKKWPFSPIPLFGSPFGGRWIFSFRLSLFLLVGLAQGFACWVLPFFGKGQMGSALLGSLQILCFLTEAFFLQVPLTYFCIPKSARAYLFLQSDKMCYFCSASILLCLRCQCQEFQGLHSDVPIRLHSCDGSQVYRERSFRPRKQRIHMRGMPTLSIYRPFRFSLARIVKHRNIEVDLPWKLKGWWNCVQRMVMRICVSCWRRIRTNIILYA